LVGAVAPNGTAYLVTYQNNGTWSIVAVDSNGVSVHPFGPEPAPLDEARSCLYSGADHSLIVFTRLGAIHKVDIASMTITASLPQLTRSANTLADYIPTAYQSGQVPTDGLVHVFGNTTPGVSSNLSIMTLTASTLTIEANVPLTSWSTLTQNPKVGLMTRLRLP